MSMISVEILKKNIPFFDTLKNIEKEYNAKIYIVGGCLRDICLNIPVHDIDITAENIEYTKLAEFSAAAAHIHKQNIAVIYLKII